MIIQTQHYAARSKATFEAPTPSEESLEAQNQSMGLSAPAFAHNVKTSGNVAALFHVAPQHSPKAGEPSKVWFALTKQGGEEISLDQCNCQITIYRDQKVVFEPPLSPLNAERYQALPSAVVLFPKEGIYQVEIKGTPKQDGAFESFKFSYDVTVQPGKMSQQITPTSESPLSAALNPDTVIDLPGILVWTPIVAIVFGGLWLTKRRRRSN
jgi:hypothetical protein